MIIAGAGGAAHLPGMLAAVTPLPVIGVPVPLKYLDGLDSLLSIVQMPAGIPVATVAVGGARNAGLLAVRILAAADDALRAQMIEFQARLTAQAKAKGAASGQLSRANRLRGTPRNVGRVTCRPSVSVWARCALGGCLPVRRWGILEPAQAAGTGPVASVRRGSGHAALIGVKGVSAMAFSVSKSRPFRSLGLYKSSGKHAAPKGLVPEPRPAARPRHHTVRPTRRRCRG